MCLSRPGSASVLVLFSSSFLLLASFSLLGLVQESQRDLTPSVFFVIFFSFSVSIRPVQHSSSSSVLSPSGAPQTSAKTAGMEADGSSSSSCSYIACARLPPEKSRKTKRWIRLFLTEVLVSHLKRRPDQLEQLNALSLYPSEEEMWNESIVPSEKYTGDTALPLPKLNLQFLTIHDYLLRNFNLFR